MGEISQFTNGDTIRFTLAWLRQEENGVQSLKGRRSKWDERRPGLHLQHPEVFQQAGRLGFCSSQPRTLGCAVISRSHAPPGFP